MKLFSVLQRHAMWCAALCLSLATASGAHAQLLVDLDVSNFDPMTGIWTDTGGLGDFTASGSPRVVTTPEGVSGILFDGTNDFFTGPAAPAGLTGLDPTRSIEVWALNPAIASEETLVSWGRRGGGDGSNISFNYGNHGVYGAVGHWGAPDKGWNMDDATTGAPARMEWHHLVYTYDGATTRVYSDGTLVGEETVGAGVINTHALDDTGNPLPIRIGSQNDANGAPTGNLRYSGLISKVRIHDSVLSDVDVLNNWAIEEGLFPDPNLSNPFIGDGTTAPLAGLPIHRYTFDDDIAGNGGVVTDSIGGANGQVLGSGATSGGGRLTLPGGTSDVAPYVDLPNGIISANEEVTIEGWFTNNQVANWSRVFEFGSSTGGEFTGPGGAGNGNDSLLLSATVGTDPNLQRMDWVNNDPASADATTGGNTTLDATGVPAAGEEYHFAVVFKKGLDFLGNPVTTLALYRNGEYVGEAQSALADLSQLNDINNMLGRSNWTGDANTNGTYEEFRIYDRALSPQELLGNYQAGPNAIPEPTGFAMAGLAVMGLLSLRRRK